MVHIRSGKSSLLSMYCETEGVPWNLNVGTQIEMPTGAGDLPDVLV